MNARSFWINIRFLSLKDVLDAQDSRMSPRKASKIIGSKHNGANKAAKD